MLSLFRTILMVSVLRSKNSAPRSTICKAHGLI
nr:MAG TPA: protein of unknown function (DUF4387) [Caudoviricetes sp.]